jgi:hypothetical protein
LQFALCLIKCGRHLTLMVEQDVTLIAGRDPAVSGWPSALSGRSTAVLYHRDGEGLPTGPNQGKTTIQLKENKYANPDPVGSATAVLYHRDGASLPTGPNQGKSTIQFM